MIFTQRASASREHFHELIGTEVTFASEIVSDGGRILYEPGDKSLVSDIEYSPGYWSSLCNDIYVSPKIIALVVNNSIWKPDTFKEYKNK